MDEIEIKFIYQNGKIHLKPNFYFMFLGFRVFKNNILKTHFAAPGIAA